MVLFNVKEDNSGKAFEMALERAKELGTGVVIATTSGVTALRFLEKARSTGFGGDIVAVSHAYGSRVKGENAMPDEVRRELTEAGVRVVTAAHALSAGERGLSAIYRGIYPLELIASTLRLISAGTKVCFEIALMAADAGAVEYKKPVVCIGGTRSGADTVCVVTPAYSSNLMESRINEILCKPDLYEREE